MHDFDKITTHDDDVNLYSEKNTNKLLNIAEECILTKNVTIRPRDLPWINNDLRKLMRERNRLYKKVKNE